MHSCKLRNLARDAVQLGLQLLVGGQLRLEVLVYPINTMTCHILLWLFTRLVPVGPTHLVPVMALRLELVWQLMPKTLCR